uniref:Uncharacterized protein n=1 Tax=Anguilla anguilla TaxID=7936 RepID=A0A0E9XJ29_ANGAN
MFGCPKNFGLQVSSTFSLVPFPFAYTIFSSKFHRIFKNTRVI